MAELSSDDPFIVTADTVTTVRDLKCASSGSDIWLCGGGLLAATLADEIDRLVLKVNPLVFGQGVSLFAGYYSPHAFALTSTTPYDSAVVVNEYERRRPDELQ